MSKLMKYTSEVKASASIAEIEVLLASAGADKVMKDMLMDGTVTAFVFSIPLPDGKPLLFRMPCDVDKVFMVLMKEYRRPRRGTEKIVREQANRTAWRILLTWVQVQVTMIQLSQAVPHQLFLPYLWDARSKQTLYEKMVANRFQFLLSDGGDKRA